MLLLKACRFACSVIPQFPWCSSRRSFAAVSASAAHTSVAGKSGNMSGRGRGGGRGAYYRERYGGGGRGGGRSGGGGKRSFEGAPRCTHVADAAIHPSCLKFDDRNPMSDIRFCCPADDDTSSAPAHVPHSGSRSSGELAATLQHIDGKQVLYLLQVYSKDATHSFYISSSTWKKCNIMQCGAVPSVPRHRGNVGVSGLQAAHRANSGRPVRGANASSRASTLLAL